MSARDKPPARFEHFQKRARALVESPERVAHLVSAATRKADDAGGGRLREFREQIALAIALVKAWMSGEYRQVSRKTIVAVVAALLYFVVPFDVIPDFLFGWGFLDDAAVLGYVFGQLKAELDAFKAFRDARSEP